ncbi:hypothetical protein ACM39_03345 [Chryseobacterium sp. FH2]|uniref:tetratricopeptide repeat protein n=1 Tax=Chryseobacterium sp. FH2 TaxID=1674291 RepID=UPI00065AAD1E|nr:hypothetical protein [Chryseobacterium sp. FH2]KMQ69160.1 hypothetical protein ACM39_03345 [Chryseobacterium sp. FH2]
MNPVDLELVKIKRQWKNVVSKNEEKPMFICLGEKHETDLFDGFIKSRMSDDYDGDDVYLIHYQEFNGSDSFGQLLWEEWKEFYDVLEKSHENIPGWEMRYIDEKLDTDAYKAFYPLIDLKKKFPHLKDSKIYLYIAPVRISNVEELSLWVKEWCKLCKKAEINDIKLVWAEHHEYKTLPSNSLAHSFRVEVDIHQLMQNTAANTNRKKNSTDTDFQQQILIASNHLSKQRYKEAKNSLKTAIKLAKEQKNKEGEISAYFMLSQTYIADGEKGKAEQAFQTIFSEVEPNSPLEIQMYMNYGSYVLGHSKKRKAEEAFEKAANIAQQIGEYAMAIECYRIIGTLNDTVLTRNKLIEYFEKCIEIGRQLESEKRDQSSLRFVASLLMIKYEGDQEKKSALDNEMKKYFGDDWKVEVEQPK